MQGSVVLSVYNTMYTEQYLTPYSVVLSVYNTLYTSKNTRQCSIRCTPTCPLAITQYSVVASVLLSMYITMYTRQYTIQCITVECVHH